MFLSRFGAAVDAAAAAVNFVCALAYAKLLRRLAVAAPKCMLCCWDWICCSKVWLPRKLSPAGAVSVAAAGIVPAIKSDNNVASIGCEGGGCGGSAFGRRGCGWQLGHQQFLPFPRGQGGFVATGGVFVAAKCMAGGN